MSILTSSWSPVRVKSGSERRSDATLRRAPAGSSGLPRVNSRSRYYNHYLTRIFHFVLEKCSWSTGFCENKTQKSDVLQIEIWQAKPPRSVFITITIKKIKECASKSSVLITIALNSTSCFYYRTYLHNFLKKQSPPPPQIDPKRCVFPGYDCIIITIRPE